jgi:hypothetical protein
VRGNLEAIEGWRGVVDLLVVVLHVLLLKVLPLALEIVSAGDWRQDALYSCSDVRPG